MYSLGSQAGLFSAVTSTFIANVQPQLQPDTGEETATLLRILIYKIDNTTFGNAIPTLQQWDGPPRSIVQVQAMLYASLTASLLSAFLATLGKQWLNQYASTNRRGTVIERSQSRQRKLDGIIRWRFDHMMEFLPFMLQTALLLLGCALSLYLWEINITVASVVLGVTSSGVILYIIIVVAGVVDEDCPYQTPSARILRRVLPHILHALRSTPSVISTFVSSKFSSVVQHSFCLQFFNYLWTVLRHSSRIPLQLWPPFPSSPTFLLSYLPSLLTSLPSSRKLSRLPCPLRIVITVVITILSIIGIIMFIAIFIVIFAIEIAILAIPIAIFTILAAILIAIPIVLIAIIIAIIILLVFLYTLVALIADVYSLGKGIVLLLVDYCRTMRRLFMSLSHQTVTLDLRCVSWILHKSLNKDVHLSTLEYFTTMPVLASFPPTLVADCLNAFIGCIRVDVDNHRVVVVRGSEELAAVSAKSFLRTFNRLSAMDPTSNVLADLRQRYSRVFSFETDLRYLPFYYTMAKIHHSVNQACNPRHVRWHDYKPSPHDHILVAQEMLEGSQVEYQETQRRKVPRWIFRFALRSLSLNPSPSVVTDCLLIIAIDLGCSITDTTFTTSDKRCVHIL